MVPARWNILSLQTFIIHDLRLLRNWLEASLLGEASTCQSQDTAISPFRRFTGNGHGHQRQSKNDRDLQSLPNTNLEAVFTQVTA